MCSVLYSAYSKHGDQVVYQLVAYKRFKTVKTAENNKTSTSKSYCGRLPEVVIHERFQLSGFDREYFCALERWSLTREVATLGGSAAEAFL